MINNYHRMIKTVCSNTIVRSFFEYFLNMCLNKDSYQTVKCDDIHLGMSYTQPVA